MTVGDDVTFWKFEREAGGFAVMHGGGAAGDAFGPGGEHHVLAGAAGVKRPTEDGEGRADDAEFGNDYDRDRDRRRNDVAG